MKSHKLKIWYWIIICYYLAKYFEQIADVQASNVRGKTEQYSLQIQKNLTCKPTEFEYNEHCYFVKNISSSGSWNIHDLMDTCQNHFIDENDTCNQISNVNGVALETDDELQFIQKLLLSYKDHSSRTLTSGFWSCWSKENYTSHNVTNFCGTWYGWNTIIDNNILGYQACHQMFSTYTCTPDSEFVIYYVLQKSHGEICWNIWAPGSSKMNIVIDYNNNEGKNYEKPTQIICEYKMNKNEDCSTTEYQNTASTTNDRITSLTTKDQNTASTTNDRITSLTTKDTAISTENDRHTGFSTRGTSNNIHGTETKDETFITERSTTYGNSETTTTEEYQMGTTVEKTSTVHDVTKATNSSIQTSLRTTLFGTQMEETTGKFEITTVSEPTTEIPTTLNYCKLCEKTDEYGRTWRACSGDLSTLPCPGDSTNGAVSWRCGSNGHFEGEVPNYAECSHSWISNLIELIANKGNIDKITTELLLYISNGLFFGPEMLEIADLLPNVTEIFQNQLNKDVSSSEIIKESEKFATNMTNVTDIIIGNGRSWKQIGNVAKARVGNKLQTFLSKMGISLMQTISETGYSKDIYSEFSYSSMQFGMQLTSVDKSSNFPEIAYPKDSSFNTIIIKGIADVAQKNQEKIASVGTIIYNSQGKNFFPEVFHSWENNDMHLNTALISFNMQAVSSNVRKISKIKSNNDEALKINAVIIELTHSVPARGPNQKIIRRDLFEGEKPTTVIGNAKCVFWDKSHSDSTKPGEWDEFGCQAVFTSETSTKCICSHLSSFAVFMMLHKYENKGLVMQLLSWICSGASIVCLILTLLIFQIFRSQLQGERETICRNICACLLVTHILALSVLDKTYFNLSDMICSYVGAVLHYTLSSGIMWMAAEGHHLYRLVLRVMDGTGKDLRKTYCVIAYGLPVLLVGSTAVIGLLLGENAYGNPELCWLSLPNYQWSFISPALLITAINTLVLILALRAAVSTGSSKEKSTFQKIGIWLRGWFTLSSLLGVTWFLGLAAFDFDVYFEYVFVVFNGSQGVLIFITRILQNEQVRSIIMKRLKKRALLKSFYTNTVSDQNSTSAAGISKKNRNTEITADHMWSAEDDLIFRTFQEHKYSGTSKSESLTTQLDGESTPTKRVYEEHERKKFVDELIEDVKQHLNSKYESICNKDIIVGESSFVDQAEEIQDDELVLAKNNSVERGEMESPDQSNASHLPFGSFSTITEEYTEEDMDTY